MSNQKKVNKKEGNPNQGAAVKNPHTPHGRKRSYKNIYDGIEDMDDKIVRALRFFARLLHRRCPLWEIQDLEQELMIVLLKRRDRYRAGKGTTLNTFLYKLLKNFSSNLGKRYYLQKSGHQHEHFSWECWTQKLKRQEKQNSFISDNLHNKKQIYTIEEMEQKILTEQILEKMSFKEQEIYYLRKNYTVEEINQRTEYCPSRIHERTSEWIRTARYQLENNKQTSKTQENQKPKQKIEQIQTKNQNKGKNNANK